MLQKQPAHQNFGPAHRKVSHGASESAQSFTDGFIAVWNPARRYQLTSVENADFMILYGFQLD